MDRRRFLHAVAAACAFLPLRAYSGGARDACRLATAWRGLATDSPQRVGIIDVDWAGKSVHVRASHVVPSRAHGLHALADGGFLAAAFRPGTWLLRIDARGALARRAQVTDEPGERRFSGHVIESADGSALLTTEFDPRDGRGYIGVRDRSTLSKIDEWATHGTDPHQLLLDRDGSVIVANGGVLRTVDDRKRALDRMDASLVRLSGQSGALLGQWRLADPRLSLRHLAWNEIEGHAAPVLGIALQAEHDDAARRQGAPVLALFDGERLTIPSNATDGAGYAGDIAPALGGFVMSCQPTGKALWWRSDQPDRLWPIATLREACALASPANSDGGVVIAAAVGVGRWHPASAPALLPWPEPIALDNHWVELAAG